MQKKVTILAPAKVNLALRVIEQRSDGYHNIDAPTVPIALCDKLEVSLRNDSKITSSCTPSFKHSGEELSVKAAKLLAKSGSIKFGASIVISKNIPVAAGLGGGSSDAAAALIACNRLWNLHWPLAKLADLGVKIGADVPFFVYCKQARMLGIGEQLEPLNTIPQGWLVLCVTKQRVQTANVYANLKNSIQFFPQSDNDLEASAVKECPSIKKVLHTMREHIGKAQMTGSGSACFAVFSSKAKASLAAASLVNVGLPAQVIKIIKGRPISLGSGQEVRQRILAPSCVGSIPTSPAHRGNTR